MKSSDADLIEKLNALPERDRADLLTFLLGTSAAAPDGESLQDILKASLSLHKKPEPGSPH